MKQQRKEILLQQFPAVPNEFMKKMSENKGAENYCIFLTEGHELFVRCFHKYSKGKSLIERQRYVFAKDGAVRYGLKYSKDGKTYWEVLTRFREPLFCSTCYGWNFDNSYTTLNFDVISKSDMKYSQIEKVRPDLPISYLKLYVQHKNLEYLVKAGYQSLIEQTMTGYWGGTVSLKIAADIDWRSNHLLKMLHLNRDEFKTLQENERYYEEFILWREKYPKYKPNELLDCVKIFGSRFGTAERLSEQFGMKPKRIARYISENNLKLHDYEDYIGQCERLKYDLHDTAICFPHNFHAMHTRLTSIIKYDADKLNNEQLTSRIHERQKFEFAYEDLILIQPKDVAEIIGEGKALCHCVGGYAERHALGQTNIFFIRQRDKPDTPYYTIEVGNDFNIRQCRGFKNDTESEKPSEILEFEERYKKYLEGLKHGSNRIDRTA